MKLPDQQPASGTWIEEHQSRVQQRDQDIRQLEDQITELAAHLHAATYRLLVLLREYDERNGWGSKGLNSCAHWLNWKCGISLGAGREKMRVAHALKDLPQISREFRHGRVSYSKVRAMTRVATPKNEKYLLMIARHGTAVHVERLVRQYRMVKRREALKRENTLHARREMRWFVDEQGFWQFRGRLTAEQGALVQAVLEQALEEGFREQQDVPAGTSSADPIAMRRADALVRMAQAYSGSASGNSGDRFMVNVHTDMETLKAEGTGGEAELEGGGKMAAETVRRVSCDAGVVHWLDGANGEPLGIGRKSRSIPPAIRRALQRRDGGCRFPGCTHDRFVDAHHIVHWADGGETSMENLALLCRRHHRLVHEGGFGMRRSTDGVLVFSNSAGEIVPTDPSRRSRGNVVSLFADHADSGIQIDPKTAQSRWLGEKMDDDLAVLGMQQLE
jgi:hypothetical protein